MKHTITVTTGRRHRVVITPAEIISFLRSNGYDVRNNASITVDGPYSDESLTVSNDYPLEVTWDAVEREVELPTDETLSI